MVRDTLLRYEGPRNNLPEADWSCAPAAPDARQQTPEPQRQMALVVDDEPMVRNMLQQLIGLLGYGALAVSSGAEALEVYKARRNEIGVVILDLFMPGMDGSATFRELKKLDAGVRVVLASGNTNDTCVDELIKAGAVGALSKPFGARELGAAILEALGSFKR